jgi:hypothetical protein
VVPPRSLRHESCSFAHPTGLNRSSHPLIDLSKFPGPALAFKTIWYKSDPNAGGLIISDIDSRHPGHRQAFIAKRTALDCPPNCYVEQSGARPRRLHFLDHGNSLHDQIVLALSRLEIVAGLKTEFAVEYPAGHPMLQWENRRLLAAVIKVDPSSAFGVDLKGLLGADLGNVSKPEQDARANALRNLETALAADRRWLIDQCPPELLVSILAEEDGVFITVPGAAAALLNPRHGDMRARQIGYNTSPALEVEIARARDAARHELLRRGAEVLNRAVISINNSVEDRIFAIEADCEHQMEAARSELKSAKSLDQKVAFNQAAVRGATLALELARVSGAGRRAWLRELGAAVSRNVAQSKPRFFWVTPRMGNEVSRVIPR